MGNSNGTKPFLYLVAEDLYNKYKDDLTKITVVFPNYRSRLFFSNYLAEIAGKPTWSPRYLSIKDMLINLSDAEVADPMKLISILYTVYRNYVKEESFDEFYFWGEILLSDFDDVDKNLVDARMLFQNIRDMASQIDNLEYLTEEQKQYLQTFFNNFSPDKSTELKERFIELWDKLLDVYNNFKAELRARNLAYEGMLYRDVIEEIKRKGVDGFESEKYAFVGFNVLNECETTFFKQLDNAGKALFYWDYDTYYTDNRRNEAGTFINKNKEMFHNQLDGRLFSNISQTPKEITYISASTENAQARFLTQYLNNEKKEHNYKDSDIAVVLCNEGLLLPVLHSIPDSIQETNVTMGFPLSQTPAYSLVQNLLNMQSSIRETKKGKGVHSYRYSDVAPLLRHPYIRTSIPEADPLLKELAKEKKYYPSEEDLHKTEGLKLIFQWTDNSNSLLQWLLDIMKFIATFHQKGESRKGELNDNDSPLYEDLYQEALFRLYTQLNRMKEVIAEEHLEIQLSTLIRLIKGLLTSISIPFKGEPVKGTQIMGFLETRNLDFKNVVLLSVNEGKLPNSGKESSFIPYNLRKGYGMTTIDHKNSLYAYYFYRLLQRAERVTILYNTATDGINRGQMSRFLLQLLVEKSDNLKIDVKDIVSSVPVAEPHIISIEKTDSIIEKIREYYDIQKGGKRLLSPTAINCYLDCSLKFYFKYVLRLKVDEDLSEEIDAPIFGSIFHRAAELFYIKYGEWKDNHGTKVFSKEFLEEKAYKNRPELEAFVDEAFRSEYFKLKEGEKTPEYSGEQLIHRKVETDLLVRLLKRDAEYAPFSIFELEKEHVRTLEIPTASGNATVKVGGIVDRIDLKEGILRTVDYKTSGSSSSAVTLDSIFLPDEKREHYLVQVFLYACILADEHPEYTVTPSLLYITKDASPSIYLKNEEGEKREVENISDISQEYTLLLTDAIAKIFDANEPFKQTTIEGNCTYCDFRNICRKRS